MIFCYLLNSLICLINLIFFYSVVLKQLQQFGDITIKLFLCLLTIVVLVSIMLPLKKSETIFIGISMLATLFNFVLMTNTVYQSVQKENIIEGNSLHKIAPLVSLIYFLLPVLLRPLDFILCMKNLILGFISYMIFLPMFQIIRIYSFCNIHDVSWGNRPQSTKAGMEHMNIRDEKIAEKVKSDYNIYRVKFLICWLIFNIVYLISFDIMDNGKGAESLHDKHVKMWMFIPYCLWIIIVIIFSQI